MQDLTRLSWTSQEAGWGYRTFSSAPFRDTFTAPKEARCQMHLFQLSTPLPFPTSFAPSWNGRNPHTLTAYGRDLDDFARFLTGSRQEALGRFFAQPAPAANCGVLRFRHRFFRIGFSRPPALAGSAERRVPDLRKVNDHPDCAWDLDWESTRDEIAASSPWGRTA